jgi:hypothetical protein
MAGLERSSGDLVAKLVGSYECELYPVFAEWVAARPVHVIDIGCAEGFYAVGLARAITGATVHAFDIDELARRRCAQLARVNGVEDRVRIGGELRPEELGELPADGVVVLSDCEGAELDLLDPARAPRLLGWGMLVEVHDFVDPSISAVLTERFSDTHEIEFIAGRERVSGALPELGFLSATQRSALLSERRPGAMRWAVMRPRAGARR